MPYLDHFNSFDGIATRVIPSPLQADVTVKLSSKEFAAAVDGTFRDLEQALEVGHVLAADHNLKPGYVVIVSSIKPA